jgi:two-component system, NarL family, nitrate/nitrite sensor histidine kinase NarX
MLNFFKDSIIFRIGILLFTISALSIAGMVSSYVITDKSANDASAVNLSGSLRKQVYLISSELAIYQASTQDKKSVVEKRIFDQVASFERDLDSNLLQEDANKTYGNELLNKHAQIHKQWHQEILPALKEVMAKRVELESFVFGLHEFVSSLDEMVNLYQHHAEQNLAQLRLIQVVVLFATFMIIFVAMRSISIHIEKPLKELTSMAASIGNGDFTRRTDIKSKHELALLGETFNSMCDSIAKIHGGLEQRVIQKTSLLKRSNDALQLLFDASRSINETESDDIDFEPMLTKLSKITGLSTLDLCLTTPDGEKPYQHMMSNTLAEKPEKCIIQNCHSCLFDHSNEVTGELVELKFPLVRESQNYGVLICKVAKGDELEGWQHQIIQSLAEQIAIALGIKNQKHQDKRISLMQERAVIARELHDSLAQSLSYLKIQVTRIQKAFDKNMEREMTQSIIDELKEGLGSAYLQLRELLTTFRLRIEEQGVSQALQDTIAQLQLRSNIVIDFNCQINNIPLHADEEIHLLQIAKEATQNAAYHSKGAHVVVSLIANADKNIMLSVEDDGVGIPEVPEKQNHYGLAILRERSRNLNGELSIKRLHPKGTGVYFNFLPKYAAAS